MTEALKLVPEQTPRELAPVDLYLRELDALARHWGGAEYTHGMVDGVDITRGVRLREEDSTTSVKFIVDRIRDRDSRRTSYTIYTLLVEVSRQLENDELPQHAREAAKFYFDAEDLADPHTIKEEKQLVRYTISDDEKNLEYELEVSYSVDKQEVLSLSTEDTRFDNEDDDDEDDELEGGVAMLSRPVYDNGVDIEPTEEGEPDVSPEAELLNDLWRLIEAERGNLAAVEITFDPTALKKMAEIQAQLEKEDVKAWRLLSMARCELQELQIQRCRKILKKFSPGKPHSAMI